MKERHGRELWARVREVIAAYEKRAWFHPMFADAMRVMLRRVEVVLNTTLLTHVCLDQIVMNVLFDCIHMARWALSNSPVVSAVAPPPASVTAAAFAAAVAPVAPPAAAASASAAAAAAVSPEAAESHVAARALGTEPDAWQFDAPVVPAAPAAADADDEEDAAENARVDEMPVPEALHAALGVVDVERVLQEPPRLPALQAALAPPPAHAAAAAAAHRFVCPGFACDECPLHLVMFNAMRQSMLDVLFVAKKDFEAHGHAAPAAAVGALHSEFQSPDVVPAADGACASRRCA